MKTYDSYFVFFTCWWQGVDKNSLVCIILLSIIRSSKWLMKWRIADESWFYETSFLILEKFYLNLIKSWVLVISAEAVLCNCPIDQLTLEYAAKTGNSGVNLLSEKKFIQFTWISVNPQNVDKNDFQNWNRNVFVCNENKIANHTWET